MAPLELYEKVYVDADFPDEDPHGEIGCTTCHGGDAANPDWKTAHKGVIKDPSFKNAAKACGNCHKNIVNSAVKSMHYTLGPFRKTIHMRMDTSNRAVMQKVNVAFNNHCTKCHSSCGQCHISRPEAVAGGFTDGHFFQKKPDMQTNCTACHGSRVQKEFMGKNKGFPADVHYAKANMTCDSCHFAKEMHSADGHVLSRYQADTHASCESCHPDVVSENSPVEMHRIHNGKVECQVCHSVQYKNCYGCHVGKDKKGLPYYQVDKTVMGFKIGNNPLKSKNRPYDYVLLRHVPSNRKLFDYYVKNAFVNFNNLPTFKYATPHNIQLKTPQTESCNACHGNKDLFLLKKDVPPDELKANEKVIVREDEIPPQ